MTSQSRVNQLIALAAPYWAGEAEVVRTYWTSPARTAATDRLWIARQCFKEFWGSGVNKYDRGGVIAGVLKSLVAKVPEVDAGFDRHEFLDLLEGLHAEFSHYCAFADIYDAIRPAGSPSLNPAMLEEWPEEKKLTALRFHHQKLHGELGLRACKFTEGGYCALFREGKALAGQGDIADRIATACTFVYEDEFGHMLAGIAGIGNEDLSDADWKLMGDLVAEQMQQRIRMRNEQFSFPLSQERIDAINRGEIAPQPFDFERAGLAA